MVLAKKAARGKGAAGKSTGIRRRPTADGSAPDAPAPAPRPALSVGQLTSHIGNKQARGAMYAKLKHKAAVRLSVEREQRRANERIPLATAGLAHPQPTPPRTPTPRLPPQKEKGAARRARQEADAAAASAGLPVVPRSHKQRTIESAREADPTTPAPGDEDAAAAAAHDEFSPYFSGARPPRLMLTTTASPKARTFALLADILEVLPAATYYRRGGASMARLAAAAAKREFTHLLVLNEGPRGADSLLVAHLPCGPTARFRLTSVRLARNIPGHGRAVAGVSPELVLAGFTTRLGARVGRLLASLFPPAPAFKARQVATFHAQRDFIFFRHHRYIFEADAAKAKRQAGVREAAVTAAGGDGAAVRDALPPGVCARLQELGPRFTLRLSALYKGLLAGPGAETEWVATRAAKGAGANRRRFVL